MKHTTFPVLFLAIVLGCRGMEPHAQQTTWVRTEVYFGLSIPNGSNVSAQQWQAFVDEVITPRFPDGLSIIDSSGQWREASGHIAREQSKLLILFHERSGEIDRKIDEIRDAYKKRFQQEAVLRADAPANVGF